MNKKVFVTITDRESFFGTVVGETTTHYLVRWGKQDDAHGEEWFAKWSRNVNCQVRLSTLF